MKMKKLTIDTDKMNLHEMIVFCGEIDRVRNPYIYRDKDTGKFYKINRVISEPGHNNSVYEVEAYELK